ncbi:hypothetical protein AB4Z48_36135 [Cupriavidus sp. 2TAF22]|uniref:hypothetical protein n=1 Tax=unclassified Cupriavidus TaxID=2640874 RepID=UPI003F8DB168
MESLSFEFVSVEEAKQILDGAGPAQTQRDWEDMRDPASPDTHTLAAAALRWLASLPPAARPLELCRHYPRIGNQLAMLAASPDALSGYVGDLLIDKRGGRQGFPGGIALELSRLQEHILSAKQQ